MRKFRSKRGCPPILIPETLTFDNFLIRMKDMGYLSDSQIMTNRYGLLSMKDFYANLVETGRSYISADREWRCSIYRYYGV